MLTLAASQVVLLPCRPGRGRLAVPRRPVDRQTAVLAPLIADTFCVTVGRPLASPAVPTDDAGEVGV